MPLAKNFIRFQGALALGRSGAQGNRQRVAYLHKKEIRGGQRHRARTLTHRT